jgi:glycosyltransferase involved in cell wall biosynthesis
MQKNRLLIVGSFSPPYHGSAIYLDKLSKKLIQEKDLEVFVVDTSDKRDDLTNLGRFDFANVYAGLRSLFKLIYYLTFVRPDVVYIPISQNHWAYFRDGLFILISSVFKAKILIHLHGSYFLKFYEKSSWLYQKFIDLTMKRVDGAIVLGKKLKYIFEKWLSTDKIFVLPNFIEWEFNEDKIRSTKNDESVVRITYLGNLLESKGIFDLLEAIKIVKKSARTKFIVNIAGKFSDDHVTGLSLREHKIRFGNYLKELGDVVNYIGEIKEEKDKFELLKNTDIFVFPSWYPIEGQPLVILEAMSCGCPVISTKDVGVIDETVIDGVNGLLVEKRNIRQLVDAIIKLIQDRGLRMKMGEESKKRFCELYTPEKHIKKFKEILEEL